VATLADDGVVAVGERVDELLEVSGAGGGFDLGLGRFRSPVLTRPSVLVDRTTEPGGR